MDSPTGKKKTKTETRWSLYRKKIHSGFMMIQSFKGTRNQRFHAQVRWTRAFHNLRMSAFTSVLHCVLQSIHGGCSGFLRRRYNCHALNTASPPRPYHQWRPRMQPRRRCSAGISADPLHPPASSVAWRPRTTIRTPGMAHGARCLGFLLPDLSGWWPRPVHEGDGQNRSRWEPGGPGRGARRRPPAMESAAHWRGGVDAPNEAGGGGSWRRRLGFPYRAPSLPFVRSGPSWARPNRPIKLTRAEPSRMLASRAARA